MLYRIRNDWLSFVPQSISSQLWSMPEGLKPTTDRFSATPACTAKPFSLVQSALCVVYMDRPVVDRPNPNPSLNSNPNHNPNPKL